MIQQDTKRVDMYKSSVPLEGIPVTANGKNAQIASEVRVRAAAGTVIRRESLYSEFSARGNVSSRA